MLIKNAALRDAEGKWDIWIRDGKFYKILPHGHQVSSALENEATEEIIDAEGDLALPPFIEPHVHLDGALTAGEPSWNISGTLFEGIERWSERKPMLTIDDAKARALKALKWQSANGVQHVRSHVDVTDPDLIGLKALLELKQEVASWMELQLVAFPQEGVLSYPNGPELLEEALIMGCDVIGGIPHFEFTREYGVESMKRVFELAEKYGRLVDIHCDEIDDEQSRFIEVVAAEAYKYGIGDRVSASHTTAMGSYNDAYAYKLFRLLKMAGINFIANPLVNIHLGGRFDTYPKRRGMTRVKELVEAGINVSFGHDDIFDPWYPLGTGNMLQVLHMGLHVSHMMGYDQIRNGIDMITTNSARTFHIQERYGIEEGKPANMILLASDNTFDAIRKQSPVRYSIRGGKIVCETVPSETTLRINGNCETITFDR